MAPEVNGDDDIEEAPAPLEHATPDVDFAEAQLANGRTAPGEVPSPEELEEFEEEDSGHIPAAGALSTSGRARKRGQEEHTPEKVQHSDPLPVRVVGFLRGSWAELQRVQWPDRRQVFQATGVVLGFVIVAGVFLGVADLVASKLVNLIIK